MGPFGIAVFCMWFIELPVELPVTVTAVGQSPWLRTEGYVIAEARLDAANRLGVACKEKGGNKLLLIEYTDPHCSEDKDGKASYYQCSVYAHTECYHELE